jgi:hypothetical protein
VSEQDRPDAAQERRRWRVWQRFMNAAAMFLGRDRTTTNQAPPPYGRSPRGQRVVDAVPHGHWLTTIFVEGLCENGIIAPLVVDRSRKGEICRARV